MPKTINISASRGAGILGLSKWKTPVQSWLEIMEQREPGFCEKNKYEVPKFEETAQFRWGHAFESAIIELAECKLNDKIKDREMLYCYAEYENPIRDEIITCHIDGMYEKSFKLHEGKTTNWLYFRDNFGEPGTDQVSIEYQIQCQHQMICTGAEEVILSVLVFPRMVDEWEKMGWTATNGVFSQDGRQFCHIWNPETGIEHFNGVYKWAQILDQMGYFHQYIIKPDKELQSMMIEKYTEFWNENIIGRKPPEPKKYDDIRALLTEPIGTIIADEELENIISEHKNIKKELSNTGPLAKRTDDLKVQIFKKIKNIDKTVDDESKDKYIIRDRAGKKIASYGKNKNGVMVFR